ncbi:MAG: RNA polymerase sigma factor [Ktedonobacterales bacterium]
MQQWQEPSRSGGTAGTGAGSVPLPSRADYEQFIALVPLHMGAVIRLAGALVGRDDAEDAAQEAMLRAWQAWPTLRDPLVARGWMLRIAANVCKDWQRGRFGTRKRMNTPLSEDDDGSALLGGDPGASDAAASLDLRAAVNALEPELRVIVALRHYAGMDATEIGAALGIPPATVRTRLRRALLQLREQLNRPGRLPSAYFREGGR